MMFPEMKRVMETAGGTPTAKLGRVSRRLLAPGLVLAATLSLQADFQGSTHLVPFDEGANSYGKTTAQGPVARLQGRVDRNEIKLRYDMAGGYLHGVLEALKVPVSSQMLVFSQTSFQRERISPQSPRAIYFGDDVYIGFIPGSPLLEIAAVDPKLGGVFYTLDQTRSETPHFVRTDQCLECHASARSMGVPGFLVRSFATDERGVVDLASGVAEVNHRTPLAERWGGWYVTGTHGRQAHRGNLIGKAAFAKHEQHPDYRGNLSELKGCFDTASFPVPHSDIVALLVFEHQTHMHNFITRLNYEATLALQQYGHLNYLRSATEAFLKYLLFSEEAPLTDPIQGTSGFAAEFAALGPKDHHGRSLREFDLQTRLLKYPCSFLIYSEAFDRLPAKLKEHLYHRLWEILTGKDAAPEYQGLPPQTKQAILEILADTKPDLPEDWKNISRTKEKANYVKP